MPCHRSRSGHVVPDGMPTGPSKLHSAAALPLHPGVLKQACSSPSPPFPGGGGMQEPAQVHIALPSKDEDSLGGHF